MNYRIVVTGRQFLGKGFRAIEPIIEEMLESAENEIQITSFVLTKAMPVLKKIESALKRGIKVTLVIDDVAKQCPEVISWINNHLRKFSKFLLLDFSNSNEETLHAKLLIVDRRKALIGSANLTWSGMFSNHEVAVLIEGDQVWKLAAMIDTLKQ